VAEYHCLAFTHLCHVHGDSVGRDVIFLDLVTFGGSGGGYVTHEQDRASSGAERDPRREKRPAGSRRLGHEMAVTDWRDSHDLAP
jgi:hypothetical protein